MQVFLTFYNNKIKYNIAQITQLIDMVVSSVIVITKIMNLQKGSLREK